MADDLVSTFEGDRSDDEFVRLEDELGRLARELTDEDTNLDPPPPDLWPLIDAEARMQHVNDTVIDELADAPGSEDALDSADVEDPDAAATVARLHAPRIGVPRGLGVLPGSSTPAPQAGHRERSGIYEIPAALAVAAVLALVLATGAALIVRNVNSDEIVAQAEIANDGLPVPVDGAGTAVLKRDGDDLILELDLPDLAEAETDSIYEVWMIDSNVEGMVSLGGLGGTGANTATIDLPDNIDHTRFPVVDISVEPLDGDPTHSGQSVLRGVLADVDDA